MKLLELQIDPKRHLPFIVIVFLSLLLLAAYYVLRVKARELEFLAYREEIARLRTEAGSERPVAVRGDPAAAAKQALQEAEQERTRLQQALQMHTANRVDLGTDNATNEVMLELSALAAQAGVRIAASAPSSERPTGMLSPGGHGDPLAERPRRRLQLEAHYADLLHFLEAMGQARHAVTVLSLEIKTINPPRSGSPLLQTELMVML